MSLLERITEKAFRALGAVELDQRQYAAGKNTRLVGDRNHSNLTANQDIRGAIRQVRANARALARDNDYFNGFLKKLESNVIGTAGLKLQVDATKSNGDKKEDLNRRVEDAWKVWSLKKHCDVTGQESLRGIMALALRTIATDGECLIRLIYDPTSQFGLKLQLLDVDWLDEDFNEEAHGTTLGKGTGNRIVMSVEYDPYDKPVAYWFTDPRWSSTSVPNLKVAPSSVGRLRIPADQIIHRFRRDRVGQGRGMSWTHSPMLTMNQLDGFDEAELVGARINASNMAFISPPAPLDPANSNQALGIDTEVSPGQILEIPAGATVHEFSPNKPQDSSFSTRMLRKIASGLGVSYATLTSDLTEVNFSSIRAGTIDERDLWRIIQVWVAENLYQDIYEKWLMFNINLIPLSAVDQVMYPIWRGRGFQWVDPLKDITASALAVDRGFTTLTDVLGDQGKDFEETIDQIAAEKKYLEKKGVTLADTVSMQQAQAEIAKEAADEAAKNKDTGTDTKTDKKEAK